MPDLGLLYENEYTKNLKATKESGKNYLERRLMSVTPLQIMFSELNLLTFLKRVQYQSMVWHRSTLVTKVSDSHMRNLRSVDNDLLRVHSAKTSYYENSFTISSAKQWNELPLGKRNSSNLNSFNYALKTYLLNN